MKNFQGRVGVITGAASGIGRALAINLADRGCNLALSDVNTEGLSTLKSELANRNIHVSIHPLDVSDEDAVNNFAQDVMTEHGAVHLLFNNAGTSLVDHAETQTTENFEWLMNINFWGVVYGTRAFLPFMRQSDEGHIINISSLFGIIAMPRQSAYNASKFAVRGYTEALAFEMAGQPIGVSCVHPGGIKTNIVRNSRVVKENIPQSKEELTDDFDAIARTTPAKAAEVILKGVEKGKRRILIGADAKILSFISRLFPGSYESILGIKRKVIAGKKIF